jgi:hypothetical protein
MHLSICTYLYAPIYVHLPICTYLYAPTCMQLGGRVCCSASVTPPAPETMFLDAIPAAHRAVSECAACAPLAAPARSASCRSGPVHCRHIILTRRNQNGTVQHMNAVLIPADVLTSHKAATIHRSKVETTSSTSTSIVPGQRGFCLRSKFFGMCEVCLRAIQLTVECH